jgi:hypothetical protein
MGPMVVPTLDVATDPPQLPVPPPAVQEVALLLLQLSTVEPPVWIALGSALNAPIVGATGALVTVTLAELGVLEPPAPEQVRT